MIKIVLVSDCIANLTGGAEKQIFELAKRLDKNKFDVTVISLDCLGQTSPEWFTSVGCHYHRFRVVRIYGLSGLIQGFRFYQYLKKEKTDIVQTYHFSSDIWATFWAKLAGVRKIISNRRDMGYWRKPWHIYTYRCINRWVNTIVVVSNSIRDMVQSTEGESLEKIKVIYNGVELTLNPATPSINELKDNIVIMHVASLSPIKGHIFLLKAFKKTLQQFKNIKLVLIGEDMLNGSLQHQVLDMGLSNDVLFLGERKDVTSLLTIADICVLPSLSEGMSNSILEYMAAAKPVIATKVGGNPELIQDGFNGLLIEKENVEQLSQALVELIKDKEKRKNFGQNGLSLVKSKFTMEVMLTQYQELYENGNIKVLHLVSSGGFFGAERVILNLASQQNSGLVTGWVGAINNKHNPHLEIIDAAQKSGFKNVIFDSNSPIDLNLISSIKKFLKENKIDILHTHNYKSDITGFLATLNTKVKWVATMHGWTSTDPKIRWYESLDRFVLKFARKIICVSANNSERLLKQGVDQIKVAIIDNGINVAKFDLIRSNQNLKTALGIDNKDIVVCIVGRLSKEKGHKILLKAISSIIPQYPNLKCLVVGDGPLMTNLQELSESLRISRHLIFTGNRQDVADIYKICDILVNASYTEGLPMTILEAMAAKVTVIATKVGAVPQVIRNGESGVLLEAGDPDTLSQAIISLIKDAQKRTTMAQHAYNDVCSQYGEQRMAENYKNLYQGLIK